LVQLSKHPQFKPGLLLLALAMMVLEILWISQGFDAARLTLEGDITGWRRLFGELGQVAKLAVAIAFTTGLVLHTRFVPLWQSLKPGISWQRFVVVLPFQIASFALLLFLTDKIFGDPKTTATLPVAYFALWLLAALLTVLTWLYLFARNAWLKQFLIAEKASLIIGIIVGMGAWALALFTRELWGPMSDLTFRLTVWLLGLMSGDQMLVDMDAKIIGLSDFAVNIAPACSGYEGVGLVTAFTAIYLWLYRQQLRFPRVFLLFPIGATAIWLLNVVRISVLILIGQHWSPEIAVGGFHSQAGWLTFIVTSLVILWLAGDSRFFSRLTNPTDSAIETTLTRQPDLMTGDNRPNQAVAMILPLVILLACSLLTSSFSAGFDWLYPIRLLAVGAAIVYVWPALQLLPYRPRPITLIAGIATAVIWAILLGDGAEFNHDFQTSLSNVPSWQAGLWLIARFLGTAVTVPIAEELAFRGYLLCKLSRVPISTHGRIPFGILAVVVSSLAFGALHGAWIAGAAAGLIYAIVRLRSDNITDAIVAHGITNALLFVYAVYTGAWHLL
jgi:exosortase E/protease (VPEID-CTERM system)